MSEGNLDPLRESLYQKTAARRNKFSTQNKRRKENVQKAWAEETSSISKSTSNKKLWFFLGGSLVFFIVAAIIATLIFLAGGRTVSPENLQVSIVSPGAVESGEVYEIEVEVINRNPVSLPFVELTVSFPDGARDPNDFSRERGHLVQTLDALKPGQRQSLTIPTVLFGEEGEEVETIFTFEFRAEDSNAVVVREERVPILISSAPLSLRVETPETVVPGDSFVTTAVIEVHTDEAIPGVVLVANYPFGFEILDATPKRTRGDRVWELGTLEPGERVEFRIEGRFATQSGSERVISFQAGTGLSLNGEELALVYMEQERVVKIESSALALSLLLNGTGADSVIVSPGAQISGRISLENSLGADLFDTKIQVSIQGEAFDAEAFNPRNGLYNESTNVLLFNRDTDSELAQLEPGDRSVITFELPIRSAEDLRAVQNPTVNLSIFVTGREIAAGSGSRPVSTQIQKNIQVSSSVGFSDRLLYSTGSFTNSGPWPMEAGSRTTFTLEFEVENTVNTLASTKVFFRLPSYVSYTGGVRGLSGSEVMYDAQSGVVSLSLGELSPQEVFSGAIQLAVTPSSNQSGSVITIVDQGIVQGVDRFTKQSIERSLGSLTSRITQDPEYTQDKGVVK